MVFALLHVQKNARLVGLFLLRRWDLSIDGEVADTSYFSRIPECPCCFCDAPASLWLARAYDAQRYRHRDGLFMIDKAACLHNSFYKLPRRKLT